MAERVRLRDLEPPKVDGRPERSAEDIEEGELGGSDKGGEETPEPGREGMGTVPRPARGGEEEEREEEVAVDIVAKGSQYGR